ncbi:MAG: sensor histidine kinase [Hymenobacter sp.]|nr:MAG: sensor histidine kinase [Hymenobacter sp.]
MNENAAQYYDTAFNAYVKAIELVNSSGKGKEYYNKLYNNISQVYAEDRKEYHTALTYLFKAVAINQQQNNIISLSYNYGNISEAYFFLKKNDLGLLYARKTLDAARHTDRPNRMLNALRQMYRAYEHVGRYDSALFYQIVATDLNDSLNSIAKIKQVDEINTQYETNKKEAAIQLLNAENQVSNTRIAWLVSGLIVVGALAIGLIALYRRVQHQKAQLAAQATRLEVMMKELHHRVKNNLQIVSSLLNMQTYKLQDEESISALKTSGERVQAMSLIHQRLYSKDELTAVNLKEYLTDLAESLMQSYGYSHQNFELQVAVDQELMDVDTALPIGLIVNELITNALKYAYANVMHPTLQVMLTGQGSSIRLSVKDNGQEFNIAKWQQGKSSFGKQLIVSLCRQLRAKQTVDTTNGTEFVIQIPLKAA